jgi:hypothetical protein
MLRLCQILLTICTPRNKAKLSSTQPSTTIPTHLQLADEQACGHNAHSLGEKILGEKVDERWEEDKGHCGLVDEIEWDKLGHGCLEDVLMIISSV